MPHGVTLHSPSFCLSIFLSVPFSSKTILSGSIHVIRQFFYLLKWNKNIYSFLKKNQQIETKYLHFLYNCSLFVRMYRKHAIWYLFKIVSSIVIKPAIASLCIDNNIFENKVQIVVVFAIKDSSIRDLKNPNNIRVFKEFLIKLFKGDKIF